jgi:hypothetical protein
MDLQDFIFISNINKKEGCIYQPGGLDQPIPAGILWNPYIAINHTHAVNTKGPVSAGKPHCPKKRCNAGITTTEQVTVAKTAIKNDCQVNGTKLVNAIITSTWLNPCKPILVSCVGNFISIDKAAPIADPIKAIIPPKYKGESSFHCEVYPFVNQGLF